MSMKSEKNNEKIKNSSRFASYLLYFTGGTAAAITLVTFPFLTPAFRRRCLPFVPATSDQIKNILMALKKHTGEVVDLGSGDGRIVHSVATVGFKAVGVELNVWLVMYSRLMSYVKGLSMNTKFYRRNLWSFDLKPYTNVIIFGTEDMMDDVEKKCLKELSDESVIITCRFPLPNLKAVQVIGEGIDTVWKYRINKKDCLHFVK